MWFVQTLVFFVSVVVLSVLASHEPIPASLNVVLVGFHNPERGYLSEYDLERTLTETVVASTLSLGEAPYNHIRTRIRQLGPRIPAQVFACELKSLADALNLGDKGFTLFILNIDTGMNVSHAYCEGAINKVPCSNRDLDLDASNIDENDRGERWARSRMTQKSSSSKTNQNDNKCIENDSCLVNAWISNDRIAWVDLSAQRIRWGNQFGLSLPAPPTYRMTLEEQRQRAKNIKMTAAKDKNCKDCASFIQAWSSLLDRAAQESNFFSAYDTVARASDELEAIISREFAITGKSDRVLNSPENSSLSSALSASAEFAAHLSLVVQSFASRVLLPFNPEFVLGSPLESQNIRKYEVDPLEGPASRVSVHLYLVRGHDDDKDLGPNGSDIDRMRMELAKLASPSIQAFSLVVHELDMDLDPVLSSAFAFALHTMIIPVSMSGRIVEEKRHYLDAKEFRQVLLAENDRAHLAFSASAGKTRNSNHMEIPVFWFFGVDSSSEPLYIDGHHRAVYLDDIGIVVESKHTAVERVDAWCGDARVKVSVSRPIRAATLAIARLWWRGNLEQNHVLRLDEENKDPIDDWTWSVGVGDAQGMSIFEERGEEMEKELISNAMIDAFHRSTVLETFRRITRMLDHIVKRSRPESEMKAIHEDKQAIAACARKSDWNCAFLKLDSCTKTATKLYKDAKSKNALVKDSRLSTTCVTQEVNEDNNTLQGLFQSALAFVKRLVPSLQS